MSAYPMLQYIRRPRLLALAAAAVLTVLFLVHQESPFLAVADEQLDGLRAQEESLHFEEFGEPFARSEQRARTEESGNMGPETGPRILTCYVTDKQIEDLRSDLDLSLRKAGWIPNGKHPFPDPPDPPDVQKSLTVIKYSRDAEGGGITLAIALSDRPAVLNCFGKSPSLLGSVWRTDLNASPQTKK